jgi:hypothetical protein
MCFHVACNLVDGEYMLIPKSEGGQQECDQTLTEEPAVGDLFSNAMNQEQGNTENVKR